MNDIDDYFKDEDSKEEQEKEKKESILDNLYFLKYNFIISNRKRSFDHGRI